MSLFHWLYVDIGDQWLQKSVIVGTRLHILLDITLQKPVTKDQHKTLSCFLTLQRTTSRAFLIKLIHIYLLSNLTF